VAAGLAELWNGFDSHFVEYKKHGGNTIVYLSMD